MLGTLFKVGLGLSVIFLGVRVGGDVGHWILNKTSSQQGS